MNEQVHLFVEDAEQSDDLTMLAIKYTRKAYDYSLKESITLKNDIKQVKVFYATPDMLSGLCGWAFYDNNAPDAVVSQFGSGCSTVVSMTIAENARQGYRCFIGLFDPSVRPYIGKNELSFTIPLCRFMTMLETMKDCFLFDSHAWNKIKARLEE